MPKAKRTSVGAIVRARTPDGRVELEIDSTKGCCGGACLWFPRSKRAWLSAGPDAEVGSLLNVTIRKRDLLLGSLVLYGLPLGALLIGGLLGAAWGDLGCLLGAGGAVTGALIFARRFEALLAPRFDLRISR